MWADFAEIRWWRATSTAADFGEIGPRFWHHSLFLSDTGPPRADETTVEPSQASLVSVMKVAGRSQRFCRLGVVGLCGRLGRFSI